MASITECSGMITKKPSGKESDLDRRSEQLFENHRDFILNEATAFYETTPDRLNRLGSFESIVYEFEKDRRRYILKITHSLHRSLELIQGELEWVRYLAEGGVGVSPVVLSKNGQLVERVDVDDSYFLVYVFEKASGRLPSSDNWGAGLFEKWGQTLGRMHRRTKTFVPSHSACRRFHWHEDYTMELEKFIPASQPLVLEKGKLLRQRLHNLPCDRDAYGLVHCDLHHGNFFVDDGRLTVFDFDDCQYHWFAFDIAIPLFYVLRDARVNPDDMAFASGFMTAFMTGYNQENHLDREWMERLPLFLKLRELELYCLLLDMEPGQMNDWCRRLLDHRRERIEREIPVIDMDFTNF
ncbi:MAG: phosphotransferase enzyme family protein [Candidatus Zixiibacteriota bacterium]